MGPSVITLVEDGMAGLGEAYTGAGWVLPSLLIIATGV